MNWGFQVPVMQGTEMSIGPHFSLHKTSVDLFFVTAWSQNTMYMKQFC